MDNNKHIEKRFKFDLSLGKFKEIKHCNCVAFSFYKEEIDKARKLVRILINLGYKKRRAKLYIDANHNVLLIYSNCIIDVISDLRLIYNINEIPDYIEEYILDD